MRLSPVDIAGIKSAVASVAGDAARVRLFGSRLDDRLRGGDIDLLIEFETPVDQPVVLAARIGTAIERRIGERRIDVLIDAPNLEPQVVSTAARRGGATGATAPRPW